MQKESSVGSCATTPEHLLEAATRLIRERGLAATSLDERCRAAGVTKGAFILAKVTGTRAVAEQCFDHLTRYLTLLFNHPTESTS